MKFKKMKFKSKKRAGILLDPIPLTELHRYTRLSDSQVDADYEWRTRHKGDLRKVERRRDKVLSLLFPPRLGTIATAWRIHIETAQNAHMFPISPAGNIAVLRPVYKDTARPRVRTAANEKEGATGKVRFVFDEGVEGGEGSSWMALGL